ncbi:DUF3993 domain-containing protein [Bacillus sp. T33-2]|uniref:DUF3993 domain-containing protein n=1 Tax=Bacillus sp. T33-2 TaxID=2054168 RepID=UPI000C76461F|nr:DUF3993 domain-containing protein [Bacillus sp. T33-2]PLR97466.1 hypothetical protein CVD19_08220 [Bacillus sp. T33-2]
MDKQPLLFILLAILVLIVPVQPSAETTLSDRESVFEFLGQAFEAQVSLSEKDRTAAEVDQVLQPYFTNRYKQMFIQENVISTGGSYRTYGSDFAPYFIPFYAFSDATKVVHMDNEIYVLEYFPASDEGPVSFDSHYEGIKLVKEKGEWKVADYFYDGLPDKVIQKAYPNAVASEKTYIYQPAADLFSPAASLALGMSPMSSLIQYGTLIGSKSPETIFSYLDTSRVQNDVAFELE